MAEEDKVAFLVKVHTFHQINNAFDTVVVVGAKRRREASCYMRGCFSKRDDRGLAKVEALGAARNKR